MFLWGSQQGTVKSPSAETKEVTEGVFAVLLLLPC
jgi:hypothetical protein